MAGSSVASPLCTWIVAACMSLPNDKKTHSQSSSMFLSLKPKRKVLAKFSTNGGFVSSICGSGFQSLVSSFEPCDEFYSKGAFFGDIGFSSIFGSKNVSLGRRERRINRASRTGKFFGDIGFSSIFGSKNVSLSRRERMINRAARSGKIMAVAVETVKEGETRKKSVTKKRRVVVTGLGVVTPLGIDADIFYNNLLDGKSGISEIEAFDCAQFPTKIAGEIKGFSTEGWVAPKLSKRADKFMLYLLTAGKKALADGGITEDSMEELDKFKCGIVIGSALGGMKVFNDGIEALRVSYKKMNPFCVPFATANMGSAMLAMDLGWMGPNYSVSAACATSNFCILNAANHIIRGETDMMLCGGSDAAIIPIGLGGFVACGALSEMYTDPTKASRPFDTTRDGFVMGEGAGVLLLEDLEHAKKRGARIYAEFLGGSFTADAYHMTEPHPDGTGVSLCIENALTQSGVAREDVNYINAHAASTQTGDLNEYLAITRCFGENPVLRVNSTKSMTGHLLGAAGAVEAVATIKAIQTGWLHPNINLESPDKGMDMNVLVGDKKEKLDIKVALSNSFGFGGHNSSILFAPYKED